MRRRTLLASVGSLVASTPLRKAKAETPGVTATEIKIGNTCPYSGPASAFSVVGKEYTAFFRMINDRGGINGRKITFISLDDGWSPPKTVEQTRKLVEQEDVAFVFSGLGTVPQLAVQKYMNAKGVPQLFVGSSDKLADPDHYRWTMGGLILSSRTNAVIYGKYILQQKPDARVGILYLNDEFGRDYLTGLKQGLGDQSGKMLVKETSCEITDPTIDSQAVTLQSAGVDVVLTAANPKFAVQMIRKLADLRWKPLHIVPPNSTSVGSVLTPAGPEKAVGLISASWCKDPTDPQWASDPGMNEWRAFMKTYLPDADLTDFTYVWAYAVSLTVLQVLKQCGNDLSRENIMKEAANLHDLELSVALPGIKVNTSPTNYHPIRSVQLQRWNGKTWELFGDIIEG